MRRRPPANVTLTTTQESVLAELLRDGHTPQRLARRACILLAMSNPKTIVEDLAERVDYTPTGI
jgi:hypothetical protein